MEKPTRLERLLSRWREELSDEDRAYLQGLLENQAEGPICADDTFYPRGMIKRRLRGEPPSSCGMTWEDVEETDEILRELGMI